ncbi:hypothetical protein [Nocardia sp. CA-135398]|uniref:hypothetical protein n=1 Tax=Nocardia sp. CA-135398 TaxID=3239977 RepID=UPI003D962F7F
MKRSLTFTAAMLIVGLAVEYGRADDHSGVAVVLAVAAAVLLLDVVIRFGRHSR